MTRQKVFLYAALAAFVGWLGYLGYAVAFHRLNPPDIVSRSQLANAPYLVVAEVTVANGKPNPTVTVLTRLDGDGPASGEIAVTNLPTARPPSNGPFPGAGQYLLPLAKEGDGYRIVGWPASPGVPSYEPNEELKFTEEVKDATGNSYNPQRYAAKSYTPPKYIRPPLVYPWTDAVQKQLRSLSYKW